MAGYKILNRPFFILAPMDDVTDSPFRRVIQNCAKPDLMMTEFINVEALMSGGREKVINKLIFSESEKNLIAQIWGLNPSNFYEISRQIASGDIAREVGIKKNNYVGVDLNMGCPQKHEVKCGACIALINNRPLAQEIISASKKGLGNKLPLSIKTRIGFNNIDLSWIEFLLKQKIDMLTIHGRTKKEKSKTPVHWDIVNESRKLRDKISPNTLIIGNGDVVDRADGLAKAYKYKLDGIMIGRSIFNDPYIFSEDSKWHEFSPKEKLTLFKNHLKYYSKNKTSRPNIANLYKYMKIYINGFNNAKNYRAELMKQKTITDLEKCLDNFILSC